MPNRSARRPLPRLLQGGAGRNAPQLPLHGPEIDHALAVSEARALLAHVEREEDLAASERVAQLPLGTIGYGARAEAGRRWRSSWKALDPLDAAASFTGRPRRDLLHLGQHRASEGGDAHPRDTRLDVRDRRRRARARPGRSRSAGSSLSHVGAFYVSFAGAERRRRRRRRPDVRRGRGAPAPPRRPPDGALDAAFGAVRADPRPWRAARRLRLAASVPSSRATSPGRAGAGVHRAERDRDRRGLRHDGGRARDREPSRPHQDRLGRAGGSRVSLSIRNDDGDEVPAGSEGRLWIKTPAATVGYWGGPAATEAAFSNGWLDSGDVMRVDDEGYFFFCGPQKQIIVHDGSNICPQEVEGALLEHPSVESRRGDRDPRPCPW